MRMLLLVALGGALGSVGRYLVGVGSVKAWGAAFPWGTLIVNAAGCFAMGLVIEVISARYHGSAELRAFLAAGVLGGFTTFSAFALDFAVLLERKAHWAAAGYLVASVGLSIAGVFAGLALARALLD
jgi:CrcB protein